MTARIHLTDGERNHGSWQKVDAYANDRLKTLREIVENPKQTEAERLGAAWRIAELKKLLALAEPAKETRDDAGE